MESLCATLKPLAGTTAWLSAEENVSISIVVVAITQLVNLHFATADFDPPVSVAVLVLGEDFAVETSLGQCTTEEVVQYFLHMPVEPPSTNPLDCWRVKKTTFPNIVRLARRFLAIPATSTPSKHNFGTIW